MSRYLFRLLNVFAESTFGGNPLCVVEDGTGLNDDSMLKLARQFNLSETVFLLPSDRADAMLRIFTPTGELPFAGHPTLGSAFVLQKLKAPIPTLTLETRAGIVPVTFSGDRFTLATVGGVAAAASRTCEAGTSELCRMLDIEIEDIASIPCWIDTGSEQLLMELQSADAVRRIKPNGDFATHWPANRRGRRNVLAFAIDDPQEAQFESERQAVSARYFFAGAQGATEDPGTGSACANLGAWMAMQQRPLPLHVVMHQGDLVDRPSRLLLDVTSSGEILVGGRVIELGQGWLDLSA